MVGGPNGKELNDDKLTRFVNMRADYRMGINDYLTVQLANGGGYREAGENTDMWNPVRERKMDNNHQFISWQRISDTDTELQLKFSHQKHGVEDDYKIDLVEGIYAINDMSLTSERYSIELLHRLRLGEKTRWVWGAELRRDEAIAEAFFGNRKEHEMDSKNAHFNLEWRPREDWIVHLGNMWEEHDIGGNTNSPRLAFNYLVGDGKYVRTAVARAYRMPVFLEEKADYSLYLNTGDYLSGLFSSEGNLEPERQDSVEVVVGSERQRYAYDIRLFRNNISNSISIPWNESTTFSGQQIFANGGEMVIKGVELGLRLDASPAARFHLSYSHARGDGWVLHRYDPDGIVDTVINDESETVPKDTLSVLFDGAISARQKVGIGYYYVSSMNLIGRNDDNHNIAAIDVNYRNYFRIGGMGGSWSIIARDINGAYYKGQDNVWRDRQAFFRLGLSF
jgi:outer membrane receptor for ferrienterochelin and colicin